MKAPRFLLFLPILILFIFEADAQGWKQFRKMLKKEFDGHRPFTLPDINYEPGTIILVYRKNEQIYATQECAFPELQSKEPSPLPSHKIIKIKDITFNANTESHLMPRYISAVAKIGIDNRSDFNLEIKHAEKHQIEVADLEIELQKLNFDDPRDKLLLERMIGDNRCEIITQSLLFYGVTFTFRRQHRMEAELKVELQKAADETGVTLTFLSDTEFSLSSDTPLFYAYDVYRQNNSQIRDLYVEKQQELLLRKRQMAAEKKDVGQ